jgi:hypothetical protein
MSIAKAGSATDPNKRRFCIPGRKIASPNTSGVPGTGPLESVYCVLTTSERLTRQSHPLRDKFSLLMEKRPASLRPRASAQQPGQVEMPQCETAGTWSVRQSDYLIGLTPK